VCSILNQHGVFTLAGCKCIVANLQTRSCISSCWISITCLKYIANAQVTTSRILKNTTCIMKILQDEQEVPDTMMSIVGRVRVGVGEICSRYQFTVDQGRPSVRRSCIE
jgi:hypothetical protein